MKRGPKARPIHILQDVKTLTKNKLYPKLGYIDYWHSNRRTEIQLVDIISIECDCEEMIIRIKSNRVKTYTKRTKKTQPKFFEEAV